MARPNQHGQKPKAAINWLVIAAFGLLAAWALFSQVMIELIEEGDRIEAVAYRERHPETTKGPAVSSGALEF